MIKEIKTAKAYIRCAESEATSDTYCPHLEPNKEYKAMEPDYFTVYTSLLALLECTRCERSTRILEVVVNDDPEELFPVRIKALAVKRINFENICKASDLWHCFQIIMPLLTDSDEAIQLALIDNPSLYKFDDLRIAVLKVLQYSKSREVASKARAIMAEDWFKMVRKLNKNAETCLPFENPVKEDFLSLYPSLTKNLSMTDYHNLNPDNEEDF